MCALSSSSRSSLFEVTTILSGELHENGSSAAQPRSIFSSSLHFSLNNVSNEQLSKRDVFSIVTMSEGIK